MWRSDRDRPDDPRTTERETERLARDEYDRPRYGSQQNHFGERPAADRFEYSGTSDHEPHGRSVGYSQATREPSAQHAASRVTERDADLAYRGLEHRRAERVEFAHIQAHELMTQHVASVHPASSVQRAARLMEECDCGALPVVADNGVLVGIVTDRDIVLRIIGRGRDTRSAIIADCMTDRVVACYAGEPVGECMRQMAQHQVRRIPIVNERGRLVGIIAQSDLARHAARAPGAHEQRALTDVVGALSQPNSGAHR
jgi:CBS domain-containing protein